MTEPTQVAGARSTEALVRTHLPLVGYVVSELASRLPSHVDRDDLVSAGMAGLAEAAAAFDPTHGVPFHRYAAIRIKGAMLDELRGNDWATRGARSRARQLHDVEERLAHRLQRTPADEEVAAALNIGVAELDRRRAETARALLSLDALDSAVGDQIPDPAPDPAAQVEHTEQLGYLRAAVAALPQRSRTVVTALFLEQRSIAEVAAEMEVSESRISQLKTEALGLLHGAMAVVHAGQRSQVPTQGGVAARRREQYFAGVAAKAAAAGLGSSAAAYAGLQETTSPVRYTANPSGLIGIRR